MGRRRHGTELKTPVTLALDPNTIATLDAFAARWGCSRSALIERLATDHLNDLCNPETIGQRVQNGTITPQQARTANEIAKAPPITAIETRNHININAQETCGHPRKDRVQLGYATICGTCGKRLP